MLKLNPLLRHEPNMPPTMDWSSQSTPALCTLLSLPYSTPEFFHVTLSLYHLLLLSIRPVVRVKSIDRVDDDHNSDHHHRHDYDHV